MRMVSFLGTENGCGSDSLATELLHSCPLIALNILHRCTVGHNLTLLLLTSDTIFELPLMFFGVGPLKPYHTHL